MSVVIPCYNHGQYIDDAVGSILNQTYRDWEVVIIDDGSTDSFTREKLSGYDRPATRAIRTENRGLPAARNRGIAESGGELVLTLDADDMFEPTFLEKAVDLVDSRTQCGVVTCGVRLFGAEEDTHFPRGGGVLDFLAQNNCCGNSLFRRICWEQAGGYDEQMTEGFEDWAFWIRVTSLGWRVEVIPELLFLYRKHGGSMSDRVRENLRYPDLVRKLVERNRDVFEQHLVDVIHQKELQIQWLTRDLRDERDFYANSNDYRIGSAIMRPWRFAKRALGRGVKEGRTSE